MPTETNTTPGAHDILLANKKNFVIDQFWSAGGNGDASPATHGHAAAFAGNGSPGGGGGACLTSVPIPNADIATAILGDPSITSLGVLLGAPGASSVISIGDFQITLQPGEEGFTCASIGDQAEGGKLTDDAGWVTDPGTMFAEGAPGLLEDAQTSGYGGGGAAGLNATAGNSNSGQTGGTAVASGGAGGNGGNAAANGSNGTSPGGGGGGGGLGTTTGGTGGGPKSVISYSVATPTTITSNGSGATAAINVQEGNTAVTTVTASGDAGLTTVFSLVAAGDYSLFSIDSGTGVLEFITPPDYEVPLDSDENNIYLVTVKATNIAGSDTQVISVTVTNDTGDDSVATLTQNMRNLANNSGGLDG